MMQKYFDVSYIWGSIPVLLPYLKITFLVTILTLFFGTIVGFLLTMAKLSKSSILRSFSNGYITILRCTPTIVLLFLVYYGIPAVGYSFGLYLNDMNVIVFVVIALSLQFSAIMSEVIRSAYQSVDNGQFEAAVSVGLSNAQAYRRIVFPQAFVVALPNLGNGVLALLQEGALAYTIGLIDIVGKANLMISENYNSHTLEVFLGLAIIYWAISICIEKFTLKLEQRFQNEKHSLKYKAGIIRSVKKWVKV